MTKNNIKSNFARTVGDTIRESRISKGYTQKELAELLQTKQPAVARLESGRELPRLDTLQEVAFCLGMKLEVALS